mmetsp:Transcript_20525/g.42065  ORF Transcript_20525/g.42065 Transcript_20525/m.42065 type:complete len:243 (-) Transcript_20525:79-807(-)
MPPPNHLHGGEARERQEKRQRLHADVGVEKEVQLQGRHHVLAAPQVAKRQDVVRSRKAAAAAAAASAAAAVASASSLARAAFTSRRHTASVHSSCLSWMRASTACGSAASTPSSAQSKSGWSLNKRPSTKYTCVVGSWVSTQLPPPPPLIVSLLSSPPPGAVLLVCSLPFSSVRTAGGKNLLYESPNVWMLSPLPPPLSPQVSSPLLLPDSSVVLMQRRSWSSQLLTSRSAPSLSSSVGAGS